MTALVSIIIAGMSFESSQGPSYLTSPDMVSVRNVATWRSYVNVAATLGRSTGGPLGGWLTDTVGWRW